MSEIRPSESELEILRILWDHGPATVRDVHDRIAEERDVGYTSVLKTLQNMHEKGFVLRDESERAHIYAARAQPEGTERRLVADFADRFFGGSASRLVMRALSRERTSSEELERIRRYLDEIEAGDEA